MDRIIDIEEGDLYDALDIVLGKLDDFAVDEKSLSKLMFTSTSKKIKRKKLVLIMI